jgi:hypothetical protein
VKHILVEVHDDKVNDEDLVKSFAKIPFNEDRNYKNQNDFKLF